MATSDEPAQGGIFNSVKMISSILKSAFSPNKPLESINKEQILIGSKFREGLSAIDIAARIIERKKEAGIPITPYPSGGSNIDLIMETIRCEEIVNALLTKAKIEVAAPAGTQLTATGANAGGPCVSQGLTTQTVKSEGIIR